MPTLQKLLVCNLPGFKDEPKY